MGAEVEYAIRVADDPMRLSDGLIYRRLIGAMHERLPASPAPIIGKPMWFFANGGAFSLEHHEFSPDHGLIEGATPECRSARQVLTALRAMDGLLERAIDDLEDDMGLLRNGRDGMDNVYGPQESYETVFVEGPWAVLWWISAALLTLAYGLMILPIFLFMFVGLILAAFWALANDNEDGVHAVTRITYVLLAPLCTALCLCTRWLGWRRYRGAYGFLATRMVVTGAGSLRRDGFHLSEKADQIKRITRLGLQPYDRGFLETGHVLKQLVEMPFRRVWPPELFSTTKRLQLGMADATMCDTAGWLAFGTTSLVLDLADAGQLDDAPRVLDPVRAAKRTSEQGMHAVVETSVGPMTAVAVQRWFCDRATAWLDEVEPVPLEAIELVRAWDHVLTMLDQDPESLVGQVDWITKQALLEEVGDDLSWEERKTVDLRYHELGGYHADLVEAGVAHRLVGDDAVARAMEHPPEDSPAAARARLIRATQDGTQVSVRWSHARVEGQVIPFPKPPQQDADSKDA